MNKTTTIIKGSKNYQERKSGLLAEKLKVAAYARVSTDMEEQKNSYQTQVDYYTNMISKKSEWIFAGIYSDEAITGTKVDKRVGFLNMINDAVAGKIDMIITKSISRFARNTVDTLQYVRMLKEHKVEVFFEEENIHTLSMDGELLLTILSSVAQQEVQNISEHVKLGIKHKMQNGKMVGYYKCLGYNYDPTIDNLVINEEEAEAIRYIFKRYIEGYGAAMIAKEMKENGLAERIGRFKLDSTSILRIIRNEKYVGDLKTGKTYTLDPISKKRIVNYGEHDSFYTQNHHPAIISREDFEMAQAIRTARSREMHMGHNGQMMTWSQKYALSSKIECGFCHGSVTRKIQISNKQTIVWGCTKATKKRKSECLDSKVVKESMIENAFVKLYQILVDNIDFSTNDFLVMVEETLKRETSAKDFETIKSRINAYQNKIDNLVELKLENMINEEQYTRKFNELNKKLSSSKKQLEKIEKISDSKTEIRTRLNEFKRVLNNGTKMDTFDQDLFETMVDRIILGGYDENGKKDSYMLTFILHGGFIQTDLSDEKESGFMKMIEFDLDYDHYQFERDKSGFLHKSLQKKVRVIAGFSNEIKEDRNHNIDDIKKKVYLESKEFMGQKTGKEIAEELGMAPTSVSRYIKQLKEG